MTDFECYKIFTAIKLHFTSEKYDYYDYNGKVKRKEESFEVRPDRYHFYTLNNNYPKRGELVYFLVSNMIINPNMGIRDLLTKDAEDNYKRFRGTLQSLSYIFDTDCREIFEHSGVFDTDGSHPILLKMYMRGEVHLETMCILNYILNFIPTWNDIINDDIVWPVHKMRIEKYTKFLKLDYDKYALRLKRYL